MLVRFRVDARLFKSNHTMSLNKYLKTTTQSTIEKAAALCILTPTEKDAEHKPISLKDGKNTIGRSPETGIRDARCSKRQIELDVDAHQGRIKIKILGINPCGVNGLMAMQNTECEVQKGDIIELVYGRHPYLVEFQNENNEPSTNEESSTECWDSIENGVALVYTSAGVRASDKIAAYDVDHTIIKTKSGNVFPKNIDDWEINYAEVTQKLKRLHESGFKICFFTNQAGIDKGKVDVNEFKQKMRKIIKRLGVPVQAFIAIADGYYRKPLPGMWEYLCEYQNDGVKVDLNKSFYVGDAAGRPEVGKGATKRRKDHSLADRLFARNIGIDFYTPEEHFLKHNTEPFTPPEFEPSSCEDVASFKPESAKIPADECEIIIMVGMPGSGKSHFVNEHLAPLGYTILNADTLGNTKACLKASERALSTGTSCVIDNTNVDAESRKKFIDLAKELNIPCRCFVMDVSLGQIRHNIKYRHLTDAHHSRINDMVFNMMKKKFKAPSTVEGLKDIVQINLTPKFKSPKDEQLYKMYLVDKC